MSIKSFFFSLPTGLSNLFSGMVSPRKENGSEFYLLHGQQTDMPFRSSFEIVQGIAHIGAVVHKGAEMFSAVKFQIKRTDTEELEVDTTHPLNKILARPNKLQQTWKQLLYMTYIYKICTGAAFIFPGFGVRKIPSSLAFLTFLDFDTYNKIPNPAARPYANDDLDTLIPYIDFYFKYTNTVRLKPSQLMWVRDANVSYFDDYSRVQSLHMQAVSIYKALVARGVMIDKKGGIGMISGSQKDSGMSIPLMPKDKRKLQETLGGYGLGAGKESVIVTDVPLKYTPFVFPTRELLLFEEIVESFHCVCDRLGISREMFDGNTTFENKRMAETSTYVNTIVPAWEDFFCQLNATLNTASENIVVVPDFSHVEALQKNELEKVKTEAAKSSMLLTELDRGIINEDMYRQQMGYEN